MSLLDPKERVRTGTRSQTESLGAAAPAPRTLLDSSWRDYIFAEIWTRPGLDRRSRYIIAISGAASADGPADVLEGYVRGALKNGELTVAELREAALHLAVYRGWSQGTILDRAVTAAAESLKLPAADYPALRAEPWDPAARLEEGAANFLSCMVIPGPPPVAAYYEGGILNFVFGEMWMRPGLDQRTRRWVTLVAVGDSSSTIPIRSHVYAAMASGNATPAEMNEFVLQYAVHGGWPRASVMQGVVFEMADRVAKGLPFI